MKPFTIAIAGLGTVGASVVRFLQQNADVITARAGRALQVSAVSARDKNKARDCDTSSMQWIEDSLALATMPTVDAVVELIGGSEGAALALAEATLRNSKPFVTANKAMIAAHGARLAGLAEVHKQPIMFEAAVAGGIPVIKTLREAMAGNRLKAVRGILNGTSNYILTRMQQSHMEFAVALQEAQDKGYAEADPTMDIDGHDTAHKLALLSSLAFGVKPQTDMVVGGIRSITPLDLEFADELGFRIKLLGVAQMTAHGLEQRVGASLVPVTSPLAMIDDVRNAVQIQGDAVGDLLVAGRGAGGAPTASAVIADLVDLARGYNGLPFGIPSADLKAVGHGANDKMTRKWYVRLHVYDRPGVVAEVSALLRDAAISIESLLQHGRSRMESVPVIITTHEVDVATMRGAMAKIEKLESVRILPCWYPIENE